MISEFDARQLRRMMLQLAALKSGKLSPSVFISNMDFLLSVIEDISLEWKQKVHDFVLTLEEVYAVALDLGHIELNEQEKHFIFEAIEGLDHCLEEMKIPESEDD